MLQVEEGRGVIPPMKRTAKQIGARIRQAREALEGVEVAALERAAGMPAGRLVAIEAGEVEATSDEVARLADKMLRGAGELLEGPLLQQADAVRLASQRKIGNSQGGRQPEATKSPDERARLAANLRAYRDAAGLSQSQVSAHLGVATNNVSVWESPTGKYGPGRDTLAKLALLYRCSPADLTGPVRSVVIRAKMAGDLSALSPEAREALADKVATWERRINDELMAALAAEQAKQKRKR